MPLAADDYIFFWMPGQPHGWASQWAYSPFTARIDVRAGPHHIHTDEAHAFPTAEHWMMACKAAVFGNTDVFARVLAADAHDMRGVKALGREVRGFDDGVWDAVREEVVFQGNVHKFRQNADMRAALAATGRKVLVEASPRDRIWGVGFAEKNAFAARERWGLNLLGKALARVREALREEEEKEEEAAAAQAGA